MTYFRENARVRANDADGDARLLRLRAPGLGAAARPFQFVLAQVPGESFILRRPLAVFDAGGGDVELLVRPVGEGTRRLCGLAPGEYCDLTGPFGRAAAVGEDALFVAGGIGLAGLFFALAEEARAGRPPELYYGARTATALYARARLAELGVEARFVTEDGSSGRTGTVVERLPGLPTTKERLMSEALNEKLLPYPRAVIACGPRPMYAALRRALGERARLYVLMEERMACGVGACRSCAVPARKPEGSYLAACRDGPLVEASEIDWGRWEETA
jgi:dihydroorotate dehydrogenase electron transfer subunit